MKITHLIWSEGNAGSFFYDGGILFIDDEVVYETEFLTGYPNDSYVSSSFLWTSNTYHPSWPGNTVSYGWSDLAPNPWISGFVDSYIDISDFADGNQHSISFVFHSDLIISCDTGFSYRSWLIDKVEIFYD